MTSQPLVHTTYHDRTDNPRQGNTARDESRVDMEQYYQFLEQIHAGLHSWGIAIGLVVSVVTNPAGLKISPGIGLDANGKHISLAVGGKAEINPSPAGTFASLAPVNDDGVTFPTPANSGGANRGSDQYLTIEWRETFDDTLWISSGGQTFQKLHTPWLRLQPLSTFPDPSKVTGQQLILGRVTLDASGNVTNLMPEYRRIVSLPAGSIELQKVTSTPAPDLVLKSAKAGSIHALEKGGLDLTVPNATDEIHLERDDGGNFAKVSLGAEKVVARRDDGKESVVIDTESGSITASGGVTASGNISTDGIIAARTITALDEVVLSTKAGPLIVLNSAGPSIEIGNPDFPGGVLRFPDATGQQTCEIDGSNGFARFNGGISTNGNMEVRGNITTPFAVTFQHNEPGWGGNQFRPYLRKSWDATQGDFLYVGATGNKSNTNEVAMVLTENQGIKFGTGTDDASGLNTELMRLTPAGNVGIGTSSPGANGAQLEVSAASSNGILGTSTDGYGIIGKGGDIGVYAENSNTRGIAVYLATRGVAGDFQGNVNISKDLHVNGRKAFKIDHPLDAAKKYLYHASVESPDMKNIYDGTVVLDTNGEAVVELPQWFQALNKDLRYQLTCIGGYAPVYIAEKVNDNRFKIAGGKPEMEVSWQVTGIRQDAWANAHRMIVEEDKPAEEQGYYLHPELYGESEEKHVRRVRYPETTQPMQPGQQTKAES